MSAQPEIIDKRSYPRVHLLRAMTVVGGDGVEVEANLRDISPAGVHAMCDRPSAQKLVPGGKFDPRHAPQVLTTFRLPLEDAFLDIEVQCRLIHLSLVENEGVALGLRFVSFRGESLENLRRFILASMEPAY